MAATSLDDSQKRALALSHRAPATAWRRYEPAFVSAASPRRRGGFGLFPALVLAVVALFAVSGLETFNINPDKPAAILFPKSVSSDQAFAAVIAAGGLPVRPARSALSGGVVWIAAAGTPDFFDKVKSYGAWAVINPFAFGGCFLVKPV